MLHGLLAILFFVQFVIVAFHAVRGGIGDVLAATFPADGVALGLHQGNE